MRKRVKKVAQIETIVQTKVKHDGFMEQNAPVKSSTKKVKKPKIEKYDFSGVHGRPYRKK